jgi:hypothetical protein
MSGGSIHTEPKLLIPLIHWQQDNPHVPPSIDRDAGAHPPLVPEGLKPSISFPSEGPPSWSASSTGQTHHHRHNHLLDGQAIHPIKRTHWAPHESLLRAGSCWLLTGCLQPSTVTHWQGQLTSIAGLRRTCNQSAAGASSHGPLVH